MTWSDDRAKARAFDAACREYDEITQAYESWRSRNRHEIPPDEEVFSRHSWLRDSA